MDVCHLPAAHRSRRRDQTWSPASSRSLRCSPARSSLSLHIATAALAVRTASGTSRASHQERHAPLGQQRRRLPVVFGFTVKIGFAFLTLSLVLFILSKTGVGRKASSKIDKLRTRSIRSYFRRGLRTSRPSDINWGDRSRRPPGRAASSARAEPPRPISGHERHAGGLVPA